jgi:uncharacterized protein YdiU (UPF0061 family)
MAKVALSSVAQYCDRLLRINQIEDYAGAVESYRESLRRDADPPDRQEILLELADCEIRLRQYEAAMATHLRAKLGLAVAQEGDDALIERTVALLHAQRIDWTIFWRNLARLRVDGEDGPVR